MNVEYFLSLVREYAGIRELTGKIIRKLVKKSSCSKQKKWMVIGSSAFR